jgi:hypothetical protein
VGGEKNHPRVFAKKTPGGNRVKVDLFFLNTYATGCIYMLWTRRPT